MSRTSFLLVEILTFLVFIGLGFTVGSNIWDNNATQIETSLPKTIPEPLLSLPDGERILLLAGVDHVNTNHPQLQSLWLLTYYLEDAPIQFLPIYPSGINPPTALERTLIDSFSLVNDNGLLRLPTAAEARTFWHDGVVCLRGVLDPDYVLAMAPAALSNWLAPRSAGYCNAW